MAQLLQPRAVQVRAMSRGDVQPVGHLLARAFNEVFGRHGYPPPFSSQEDGVQIARWYFRNEPAGAFVSAIRDQVVGAAFLHRRGSTASIGPVAVDVKFQNLRLGRTLMERLLEEAGGCRSVRLFQDAFNADSFALYSRLGFRPVDVVPIVLRAADPVHTPAGDARVRAAGLESLDLLHRLDSRLTGISRRQDLQYLADTGVALILRRDGIDDGFLCAYSSREGAYVGPAAASDEQGLYLLLQAIRSHFRDSSLIFRFPGRQPELLRRLLLEDYRVCSLGTLMVRGDWEEPKTAQLLAVFPESL